MARGRHHHEDHVNHEAWAIPYGDLVTLLLAFFVVMYAISSVNEGKYRVVSDALNTAFSGVPRTMNPIEVGRNQLTGGQYDTPSPLQSASDAGPITASVIQQVNPFRPLSEQLRAIEREGASEDMTVREATAQLEGIAQQLESALAPLVARELVTVRRESLWLEVEIQSDLLFASGSADLGPAARDTIIELAQVLSGVPNGVRVEGYTDDVPINTLRFPSNWQLSAARSASVLELFEQQGVDPRRLAVVGYGEHRPREDNATPEGRNANRRVVLIILADPSAGAPALTPATVPTAGDDGPAAAQAAEPPPADAQAVETPIVEDPAAVRVLSVLPDEAPPAPTEGDE